VELHHSTELTAVGTALETCARYLDGLPLSAETRDALLAEVARSQPADERCAMTRLHGALAGVTANEGEAAYASVPRRLHVAYGEPRSRSRTVIEGAAGKRVRLHTTPPLARSSMAPHAWLQRGASAGERGPDSPDPRGHWHRSASMRRIALSGLVIAQTWIATDFMASVLPYQGRQVLEIAILVLFAILFGWISAGFWTAMAGFVLQLFRRDRYMISHTAAPDTPVDPDARTAIIMPIYNEDVTRVFAGLRATYESLARRGTLEHFDLFILSDSNDPDVRVAERQAWIELCAAVDGWEHIYYRWRQHRIKRKSGNVADFCRRWGRLYRYMVVLDADSVMSGDCLTRLVQLMEANPGAGIIQTAPHAAGRDTLHARVQQFATRVYGPLFTAGLHFWQLGESHYWGHNAIIRVAPFMRHCALGRLPGSGSLSGEILSHDFVEAALMRRAGWAVWIAYDLPGSYEEMPPNLVDELQRDRRWCQGNLMNARLFLMKGLNPAHRAVFMTGVMAYLSAPLWFLQLLLATALLAVHTLKAPQYFVEPYQIFPLWPEYRPERAIALFSTTAVLLFLPKIAAAILIALRGAAGYGGRLRLFASMFVEMIISALLAPIRMLFHTEFVLSALFGWHLQWTSPPRTDAQTSWTEAFWRHGWHTTMGMAWAGLVYWLNPSFLWWLLPVVGALILSIPISVYTSRVSLGRALRRASYFLIPEEVSPPAEIRRAYELTRDATPLPGFEDAAMHPVVNAIACASGAPRIALAGDAASDIVKKAHASGIQTLDDDERSELLRRPVALSGLHLDLWSTPLPNGATDETPANGNDCTTSAESAIHAPVLQHTRPS
jgi:membrane glycosyltransferase